MTRLEVRPEEELLLAIAGGRCALPVADPDGRGLRWSRLLRLSRWHRMLPLLWDHVRDPASGLEPPEVVAAALREAARESTARSLRLRFERDRILAVFAREGVPAMLLKGAALVEEVYPEPGLRPMVDLDLLVPVGDIARAHELVQPLGYRIGKIQLGRDDERRLATRYDHYPLISADGTVVVELHHHLVDQRPSLDVSGMWARARPGAGAPPYLLQAPEDLLLHLGVHFAADRLTQRESALGQLADVVRTIRHWDLDWDALVLRARAGEVADWLFLSLESARLLFGDVAPPEVVAALRPRSYTAARGELFVQARVLTEEQTFPMEAIGLRRVFAGRAALERYVVSGEPTPSIRQLRVRRWRAILRRAVTQTPSPRGFVRDARLARWTTSLRR